MVFDSAQKTWDLVSTMLYASYQQGINREQINQLFNANPPFTVAEARENRIETNISWGEPPRIAMQAQNSFCNAMMKSATFFTATSNYGDSDTRAKDSSVISHQLNRVLKRSTKLRECMRGKIAQAVLHGIGPSMWMRERDWCPQLKGVEDILVPTGTYSDLSNLDFFAVYEIFTKKELEDMTSGDPVDPAWNMDMVGQILAYLDSQQGTLTSNSRWLDQWYPEKVGQTIQEKSTYYGADATPAIRFYSIYFAKEVDGEIRWCRRMIVDQYNDVMKNIPSDDFVYDSGDRSYGDSLEQILHIHWADGSVVAPRRWHNTRSLGFFLYGPCHFLNRYRCRLNDACFENLNWYFTVEPGGDKERMQKIDLFNMSIFPDGFKTVGLDQRNPINWQVAAGNLSGLRQLIGEHAASYLQPNDSSNPQREMTATEVVAQVNQSASLLQSMLTEAYQNYIPFWQDILRRFFTIEHADCKKFREKCEAEGVDKAVWNHWEDFDIDPTMVTGSGIKTLEMSMINALMQVRTAFPPAGQQEILHRFAQATTDDPGFADRIAPLEPNRPSESAQTASAQYATLMLAQPVVIADGINVLEWCETLVQMLDNDIIKVEQSGNTTDAKTIAGMVNVIQTIEGQVKIIEADPLQREWVKAMSDTLGRAQNKVKGFAQRLQQQMMAAAKQQQSDQANGQANGEAMKAQGQMQIDAAKAQQEMALKNAKFAQEQQHADVRTAAEVQRDNARTTAEVQRENVKTADEIHRGSVKQVLEAAQQANAPKNE